ncbi:MAG TPA: 2-oxo-4-hydroxy-4-carboxy-5-ureidoimidazoline decarboxylase [Polyangia bacterium]|nr:2-oxo-4-hydroxy-4-carboxy-5-ureidoimidazoline decarboxylase [Polyangia bacterium]
MLNALNEADARAALTRCCGAARWVTGMLARRPFSSTSVLHASADEVWAAMKRDDVLEAFAHHPRIGGSATAVAAPEAQAWSSQEQARVADAGAETRAALVSANERYFARFGYIFIVCATGKSADEMLALLEARLPNDPERELDVAAAEQAKITHLRLEKLAS